MCSPSRDGRPRRRCLRGLPGRWRGRGPALAPTPLPPHRRPQCHHRLEPGRYDHAGPDGRGGGRAPHRGRGRAGGPPGAVPNKTGRGVTRPSIARADVRGQAPPCAVFGVGVPRGDRGDRAFMCPASAPSWAPAPKGCTSSTPPASASTSTLRSGRCWAMTSRRSSAPTSTRSSTLSGSGHASRFPPRGTGTRMRILR